MPLILPGNVASATAATGYTVDNSCRFNVGRIVRTFGSTSNRRTWTMSVWLKKSSTTTEQNTISAWIDDGGLYLDARFDATQEMNWYHSEGSGEGFNLITDATYRDPSAWYNFVFAVDTTQSVAANRCKLYVNGVQETSFSTEDYPNQNFDTSVNVSGYKTSFGSIRDATPNYAGYMAEIVHSENLILIVQQFGSR